MPKKSYIVNFTEDAQIGDAVTEIMRDAAQYIGGEILRLRDGDANYDFAGHVFLDFTVSTAFDFIYEHNNINFFFANDITELTKFLLDLKNGKESFDLFSNRVLVTMQVINYIVPDSSSKQ